MKIVEVIIVLAILGATAYAIAKFMKKSPKSGNTGSNGGGSNDNLNPKDDQEIK